MFDHISGDFNDRSRLILTFSMFMYISLIHPINVAFVIFLFLPLHWITDFRIGMDNYWQLRRGVPPPTPMSPPEDEIEYQIHMNLPSIAPYRNLDAIHEADGPFYRLRPNPQPIPGPALYQQYISRIEDALAPGRSFVGEQDPNRSVSGEDATVYELSSSHLASSTASFTAVNERSEGEAEEMEISRRTTERHTQQYQSQFGNVSSAQSGDSISIDPTLFLISPAITPTASQRAALRQYLSQPSNSQIQSTFAEYNVQQSQRRRDPILSSGPNEIVTLQTQGESMESPNLYGNWRRNPGLAQLGDNLPTSDRRGSRYNRDLQRPQRGMQDQSILQQQRARPPLNLAEIPTPSNMEDPRRRPGISFYGLSEPPSYAGYEPSFGTSSNPPSIQHSYGQTTQDRNAQNASSKRSFLAFSSDDPMPSVPFAQRRVEKRVRRSGRDHFDEDNDEGTSRPAQARTIAPSPRPQARMLGIPPFESSVSERQQRQQDFPTSHPRPPSGTRTLLPAPLAQSTWTSVNPQGPSSHSPLGQIIIPRTGETYPPEVTAVLLNPGGACRDP